MGEDDVVQEDVLEQSPESDAIFEEINVAETTSEQVQETPDEA